MEQILNLTLRQFNDRIRDCFILENHFKGDGKGRTERDSIQKLKKVAEERGLPEPKAYIIP